MRRIIASVAALLLALAGVGVVLAPAAADPPPETLVYGCTIRLLSTGPAILDDAAHDCSPRVTGVSLDASGNLVIAHDTVGAVVSVSADHDDALIDRHVDTGASVGLSVTVVKFAVAGTFVRGDSTSAACSTCNVFMIWLSTPAAPSPSPTLGG